MLKSKSILTALSDGLNVNGVDGAALPESVRQALLEGALAIEFRQRAAQAFRLTSPATGTRAQERAPTPTSRWSPQEDDALLREFLSEGKSVREIAKTHNRTAYAVAIRLSVTHNLLSSEQADDVREGEDLHFQAPQELATERPDPEPMQQEAPIESPAHETPASAGALSEQEPEPVVEIEPQPLPEPPPSFDEHPPLQEGTPANESEVMSVPLEQSAPAVQPAPVIPQPEDWPAPAVDYAALFGMELQFADERVRTFITKLQTRAKETGPAALLKYLDSQTAKQNIPHVLLNAFKQKVQADVRASAT